MKLRRPKSLFFMLSLLALSTLGCVEPHRDVGEFEPYLQQFETDFASVYHFQIRIDDIDIHRGELSPSKLAMCTHGRGTSTIIINGALWDKLSAETQEITLFHELGHCKLNRKHDNSPGVEGRIWHSMMQQHPQLLPEEDYIKHRAAYIIELFTSHTSTPDISE
jgi:hypothetical protein